jgi:hypothetical protein
MNVGGNAHSVYTHTDIVPRNNPRQSLSEYRIINPIKAIENVTVRLISTLSSRRFPGVAVSADSSGTECVLHNCVMSSAVLTVQMNKSKNRFSRQ